MGVRNPARLRGLTEGQERLSLPSFPKTQDLMKPRQGRGGTVPKGS